MRRVLFFVFLTVSALSAVASDLGTEFSEMINDGEFETAVEKLEQGIKPGMGQMERMFRAQSMCQEQCPQCFDGVECNWECARNHCVNDGDETDVK